MNLPLSKNRVVPDYGVRTGALTVRPWLNRRVKHPFPVLYEKGVLYILSDDFIMAKRIKKNIDLFFCIKEGRADATGLASQSDDDIPGS